MKRKNKYILLFLFLILIIILLYKFTFNKYESFTTQKICVVGNGPLTKKDVNEINKHDIICEMNKRNKKEKNNINGTHLFLRSGKSGYHGINGEIQKSIKNVIFMTGSGSGNLITNKYLNNIKKIDKNINTEMYTFKLNNKDGFTFDNKTYNLTNSPSAGIIVLKYILEKYPNNKINIYGMNSIKKGFHNHKLEKEMMNNSKNCILHKTWKDTYEAITI